MTLETSTTEGASSRRMIVAIVAFAALAPAALMVAPAIAGQLVSQLALGPSQVGNLLAIELGALSLATLPAYWWLPRVSWRRAALLAGLVFVAGNIASALFGQQDYGLLMTLRFVTALAAGSLMIVCISAAALTANKDRVYGLWVMGQLVVGAVGLALLPPMFEIFGLAFLYWLLAGSMLACLPLARFLPAKSTQRSAGQRDRPLPRLKAGLGVLAIFTFYIDISGVWTFIGAIATESRISAEHSGTILAIATLLGIVGAACASLLGKWAAQGQARRAMLLAGYAALVAATLALMGHPGMARFVIAALVFKFTWTFILPFALASLAELDPSGRLMNTVNLVIGGGLATGPLLAGQLIEAQGHHTGMLLGASAAGLLSLALILSSSGASTTLRDARTTPTQGTTS
ncbi:MFS transporter [Halomonas sp. KM-1]|uniref:MFS transporter n=1 Tax=Halomonas sp. KM-1 TaxID=590061 RepID=UPI0002882C68|nr:MFS transporter [Halomonas sp. KM-1]